MSPILQSLANGSAQGYGAFFGAGAAPAFESIATATGTGSSGTITFSSIPSTYQHLQIRWVCRSSRVSTDDGINLQFNSDTGSNYVRHQLFGDGATASASGGATQTNIPVGVATAASVASNIMGVGILDIHDYASTSKYKTIRSLSGDDQNNTNGIIYLRSGLWQSTNAISSISLISSSSSNWTTQTTFALYGIKGA